MLPSLDIYEIARVDIYLMILKNNPDRFERRFPSWAVVSQHQVFLLFM